MKYLLLIALIACASAGPCVATEEEMTAACKEYTDVMEDPDWGMACFADETCMADITKMSTPSDAMAACEADYPTGSTDECGGITCIVTAMDLQYADLANMFNCMRDQCCFGTLSKFAYSLLLLFVLSFMK